METGPGQQSPGVFHWPQLTLAHSIGLPFLSRLLFNRIADDRVLTFRLDHSLGRVRKTVRFAIQQ